MNKLPPELIEKILLYSGLKIAIIIKNNYYINKLYNKEIHDIAWSILQGNLEVIEFILQKGLQITRYDINRAAMANNLEAVKFLVNNKKFSITNDNAIDWAAVNGNLEMLEWLFEKGYKVTNRSMEYAAGLGHLETLIWLHNNGGTYTNIAIDDAKNNGYIEVVKYLETL